MLLAYRKLAWRSFTQLLQLFYLFYLPKAPILSEVWILFQFQALRDIFACMRLSGTHIQFFRKWTALMLPVPQRQVGTLGQHPSCIPSLCPKATHKPLNEWKFSEPQTLSRNAWPTPSLSVDGIQVFGHLERRWSHHLKESFWKRKFQPLWHLRQLWGQQVQKAVCNSAWLNKGGHTSQEASESPGRAIFGLCQVQS